MSGRVAQGRATPTEGEGGIYRPRAEPLGHWERWACETNHAASPKKREKGEGRSTRRCGPCVRCGTARYLSLLPSPAVSGTSPLSLLPPFQVHLPSPLSRLCCIYPCLRAPRHREVGFPRRPGRPPPG